MRLNKFTVTGAVVQKYLTLLLPCRNKCIYQIKAFTVHLALKRAFGYYKLLSKVSPGHVCSDFVTAHVISNRSKGPSAHLC